MTNERLIYVEDELPCRLCGGNNVVLVSPLESGPNDSQPDECPWCLRRSLNRLQSTRSNPVAIELAIRQLGEMSSAAWQAAEDEDDSDASEVDEMIANVWGKAERIVTDAVEQLGLISVTDHVVLPKSLTAENGAKSLLTGEFFEDQEIANPLYTGEEDDDEPEFVISRVYVSWTTLKKIYAAIVKAMAKPLTHYCDSDSVKR